MTAQNGDKEKEKGGFKATVLVPVGSNLTREVPTPPLGNPGTDTTHEGAFPGKDHVHGTRER